MSELKIIFKLIYNDYKNHLSGETSCNISLVPEPSIVHVIKLPVKIFKSFLSKNTVFNFY